MKIRSQGIYPQRIPHALKLHRSGFSWAGVAAWCGCSVKLLRRAVGEWDRQRILARRPNDVARAAQYRKTRGDSIRVLHSSGESVFAIAAAFGLTEADVRRAIANVRTKRASNGNR